jgi:hypothetical protein
MATWVGVRASQSTRSGMRPAQEAKSVVTGTARLCGRRCGRADAPV